MSPMLVVCSCGALVAKRPCPSCKSAGTRRRNAVPHRRAHRSRLHKQIAKAVLRRDGRRCHWCGAAASTCDYVVPLALGGLMTVGNAVAACVSCNSSRGGSLAGGGRGVVS